MTPLSSPYQTNGYNIPVIDNEEDVLDATKEYLSFTFSFTIDTAGSGEEALAKIADTRYDAIISDYEMETMSGIDILKTIRARGDDTPFIIFTGRGREEVVIAAFENGADGYVMKGGSYFYTTDMVVQSCNNRCRSPLRSSEGASSAFSFHPE